MTTTADSLHHDHPVQVATFGLDTSSSKSIWTAPARVKDLVDRREIEPLSALLCDAGGRFAGPARPGVDGATVRWRRSVRSSTAGASRPPVGVWFAAVTRQQRSRVPDPDAYITLPMAAPSSSGLDRDAADFLLAWLRATRSAGEEWERLKELLRCQE